MIFVKPVLTFFLLRCIREQHGVTKIKTKGVVRGYNVGKRAGMVLRESPGLVGGQWSVLTL